MLSLMKVLGYHLTLVLCISRYTLQHLIILSLYYVNQNCLKLLKSLQITHVQFSNKGIELINLPSIFNYTDVTPPISSSTRFPTPADVYNLPKPILNSNKVTSGVNIDQSF